MTTNQAEIIKKWVDVLVKNQKERNTLSKGCEAGDIRVDVCGSDYIHLYNSMKVVAEVLGIGTIDKVERHYSDGTDGYEWTFVYNGIRFIELHEKEEA